MGRITFEVAKERIESKFSHLKLLIYNGCNKQSLFMDIDFGEFYGDFTNVRRGDKNHPERAKINKLANLEKTNLDKYGVKSTLSAQHVKDKIRKTNLTKYGFENPMQCNEVKEKITKSNLEKHGVKSTLQLDSVKEKIRETNLARYGVSNPAQCDEVKDKVKKTNLKRYGVECSLQANPSKEKSKATCLAKYNTNHPSQSQEVKDKVKKSNLRKYGVSHTFQVKKFQDLSKQTLFLKYGHDNVMKCQNIINAAKQTKIANGVYYNIDGYCLKDYYKTLKLEVGYTTAQQHYKKFGDLALNPKHYYKYQQKSKISDDWLGLIEIDLTYSIEREFHVPNTKYHADGYDPKTNTIYEFYGDFWHGNPDTFDGNLINPLIKKTYQELLNKTLDRERALISLGYNIIVIWESHFRNHLKETKI